MMDTSSHTDLQQQAAAFYSSSSSSSSSSSASLAMVTPYSTNTAMEQRPIPAARGITATATDTISSSVATTTPYSIPTTTVSSTITTHGFHPLPLHSHHHPLPHQHQQHHQLATDMANYSLEKSFVLGNGSPASALSPMSHGLPSTTLPINMIGGQQSRPGGSHPITPAYPYSPTNTVSPSTAYGGAVVAAEPFASHPPLYRPSASGLPIVESKQQQQRYYEPVTISSSYPLAVTTTVSSGMIEPGVIVVPASSANSWVSPLMIGGGPSSNTAPTSGHRMCFLL